jgi:hypothetical protein
MQKIHMLALAALTALILPSVAQADTVTIAADPNAFQSNFGQCPDPSCQPGSTATVGYTITTSDNGSSVIVAFSTTDPNALPFANLYFDTVANNGMGSDLGFEASATQVNDAFDPDTGMKYTATTTAAGSGFSSVETVVGSTETITVTIPNSYFLTDPDGIGFAKPASGTDVSLHLSQTFGYSVVGGGANFPAPSELGEVTVTAAASPVPEPAGITYMAMSSIGLLAEAGRRLRSRKRA